jgi:hypothetical protein
MAAYIDLSEKHGHRNDHGFACGAEFNVKIRRRINIPDFVREKLSQSAIDEIWWEEAGQARDSLKDALSRRYKWVGEMAFVGRGPGWLAIEDTGCRPRNWDTIDKVVDQYLKEFIKSMEAPSFWRDIAGVASEKSKAPAQHHATRKKSPARLEHDIHKALILSLKPGAKIIANGYPGSVVRVTPYGMVEVRLPGGVAAVSPEDVQLR